MADAIDGPGRGDADQGRLALTLRAAAVRPVARPGMSLRGCDISHRSALFASAVHVVSGKLASRVSSRTRDGPPLDADYRGADSKEKTDSAMCAGAQRSIGSCRRFLRSRRRFLAVSRSLTSEALPTGSARLREDCTHAASRLHTPKRLLQCECISALAPSRERQSDRVFEESRERKREPSAKRNAVSVVACSMMHREANSRVRVGVSESP
jgi:hypothetical protein